MRIGLLLGSFNPITVAHISVASCVINSGLCDKVLFVVAKHNPWKEEEPAPFDVRCRMIESAIKPFGDKCEVCRFEEGYEAPVYSYLPINEAIEKYPNDEIYLIGGTDTIISLPKWKNFETHIKNKIGIIHITRGKEGKMDKYKINKPFFKWMLFDDELSEKKSVLRLDVCRVDVSSTMVRNMVKDGITILYPYVTEEVNRIIIENNLYK